LDGSSDVADGDAVIEDVVTAMSSDEIEVILNDPAATDLFALAAAETQFSAEIYGKELRNGEVAELTFTITKDEVNQLAETGLEIQTGMMGIDFSEISGDSQNINIRVGNQWFLARDLEPEYVDPFVELALAEVAQAEAEEGSEDESAIDLVPNLDELELDLVGFDWVVTIDELSYQQVATSSNETHQVMVELAEMPPRIKSVEIFSIDGNDAMSVTLTWGEDAALEVKDTYPRTSVTFEMDEDHGSEFLDSGEELFVWEGELNSDHNQEVPIGELELRVGEVETVDDEEVFHFNVSMALEDGEVNITDGNGAWWLINYSDEDENGLVSASDEWRVETNATGVWGLEVRFYDHWADSYQGGPLPGFELVFLIGALAFAAIKRRTLLP
jgi:hypothetical protein